MLDVRPLTPALQKVAATELNEDPARVADEIKALRAWIQQQPHLKARTADQFLLAFLRGCNHNLDETKEKIDKFYALREKSPDFLKIPNFDDPKVRKLLRCGVVLYLPKPLSEAGPRVLLLRNGAYSTSEFSFADIARLRQALIEIVLLEDDYAVVGGLVTVMDFGQVGASHLFQFKPGNMRKVSQYTEEAVPLRIKGSHFIDTPMGFEPIFNLFKPLTPERVQTRLYVHGAKRDELYKFVPKAILPVEYGGENGTIQELIDYWEQKVLSYGDYFKADSQYGVDESLRPKHD